MDRVDHTKGWIKRHHKKNIEIKKATDRLKMAGDKMKEEALEHTTQRRLNDLNQLTDDELAEMSYDELVREPTEEYVPKIPNVPFNSTSPLYKQVYVVPVLHPPLCNRQLI